MTKSSWYSIVFASTLLLSGCGGWDQNPFAGKDSRLKDGWPVPTKPIGSKPVNPEMITISAPYFVSYEEDVNRRFQIVARVLEDGYVADLIIENLADFPGATYDTNNNIFSWTPARGYVESTGPGVSVLKELKIRVNAFKNGAVVFSGDHKVEIRVFRDYTAPTISRIDMPRQVMREGETMDVAIFYTDKDADPNDRSTWSDLKFESLANTKSIAGLVYNRSVDRGSLANEYVARMRFDLSESELTPSLDTFSVGLSLVSRYGKSTAAQQLNLTVLTGFAAPVTTWAERLLVTVDTPVTYKFVITDPKLEQNLNLDAVAPVEVPAGANIQCLKTGVSVLNCTLNWTPAAGQEGDHELVANVAGSNTDVRDTFVSVKRLYLRARVQPKGP